MMHPGTTGRRSHPHGSDFVGRDRSPRSRPVTPVEAGRTAENFFAADVLRHDLAATATAAHPNASTLPLRR
jgi:hypothetical protein